MESFQSSVFSSVLSLDIPQKMAHVSKSFFKMMLLLATLIACNFAADVRLPDIVAMPDDTIQERAKDYKGSGFSMVFVGPHKYVLAEAYRKIGVLYYTYTPRVDDIFLIAYPRTGQNWMSQLMWLLPHKIDTKIAKMKPLPDRVPLLEESLRRNKIITKLEVDELPSPRVMRTQLPFSLIPSILKSPNKKIYLARNPKDVIVSTFKNIQKTVNFSGTIEKFFYYIENNLGMYTPYWDHLREGLDQINNKNVLVVYAEEKPEVLIKKVSEFLGFQNSPEKLQKLAPFLKSIEQIDQISWKKEFSDKLNQRINKWIKNNIGNIHFPNIPDLYA